MVFGYFIDFKESTQSIGHESSAFSFHFSLIDLLSFVVFLISGVVKL